MCTNEVWIVGYTNGGYTESCRSLSILDNPLDLADLDAAAVRAHLPRLVTILAVGAADEQVLPRHARAQRLRAYVAVVPPAVPRVRRGADDPTRQTPAAAARHRRQSQRERGRAGVSGSACGVDPAQVQDEPIQEEGDHRPHEARPRGTR